VVALEVAEVDPGVHLDARHDGQEVGVQGVEVRQVVKLTA
jgi:hypothetical protein